MSVSSESIRRSFSKLHSRGVIQNDIDPRHIFLLYPPHPSAHPASPAPATLPPYAPISHDEFSDGDEATDTNTGRETEGGDGGGLKAYIIDFDRAREGACEVAIDHERYLVKSVFGRMIKK